MKKVMKLGMSRRCSREMLLAWHFTIFSEGVDEHAKMPIIEGRLGLRPRPADAALQPKHRFLCDKSLRVIAMPVPSNLYFEFPAG